ncbi:hypothetical protein G6F37_010321 [Rhizopus arrhizus]|nr:hypothetical protein G6F37_010321 [Rhizopus arrhizus]
MLEPSRFYYLPPINDDIQQKLNKQCNDVSQPSHIPKHIVSPEAIREAQKEEKEEPNKPFSKYSSLLELKQTANNTITSPTSSTGSSINSSMSHIQINQSLMATKEDSKRPPNAYLLFNRDMRRKLLESNPKMTVAEISKEIGDSWKKLTDDQREHYTNQASIIKEERLKKYPDYTQKPTPRQEQSKNNKKRNGQKDPRGRKKKRNKHPFGPKHPMSAYLHYLADVYPKVSQNFPGSTVGPISKSISATWHAMSPEQRQPWTEKAELDKARYAREMQIYMEKTVVNKSVT